MEVKDTRDNRETVSKIAIAVSLAIDLFLLVCFVVGSALGLNSNDIGFMMLSIVFRYGPATGIASLVLKLVVIALSFRRETAVKRKLFFASLFSMKILLCTGGFLGAFYYIGKIMSTVG